MSGLEFNIVFWLLLGIFSLTAIGLATATLINVLRLRNVRLSWKTGKLKGYPLLPSLFLFVTVAVVGLALHRAVREEVIAAGLFAWIGLCWFSTSFWASKRYITDHGMVKNINEPSQTVAWHQVRDFVEKEQEEHIHYTFIYSANIYDDTSDLIRFELQVPKGRKKEFRNLISHKLGQRIRCYVKDEEAINVEQFE